MLKGNCPSCGAEIKFRSKISVLAVCSYCRSNIIRHDLNLELIGKQSELQEDMSPIQLGCHGRWQGKPFWVLGKQTMAWEDGRWNEWYIAFQDNHFGWLAEAQGEFMLLEQPKTEPNLPSLNDLKNIGNIRIKIDNKIYQMIDKKKVKCLSSSGELPFRAVEGDVSYVYDFSDNKGGFASLEMDNFGSSHVYVGEYTSLAKLKMEGLRIFEGWGRP